MRHGLRQPAGLGTTANDQRGRRGGVLRALALIEPLPVGADDIAAATLAAPGVLPHVPVSGHAPEVE
eukprot:6980654-Alexandrium_andersonii.AAC.1